MDPEVSVLMSVYNCQMFVQEAVNSILCQTFGDFEFIIIDDGSTDGTWQKLEECAAKDGRIFLGRNPVNMGLPKTHNFGISLVRGRYLARQDADDISCPDRLERQVRFMNDHPECVASGSQMLLVDADGDPLRIRHVPLDHESIDRNHINGLGGQVSHPTLLARAEAVRDVGGYREKFACAEDMDLMLRLAEIGTLANLSALLVKYRVHGKNVTVTKKADMKKFAWEAVIDAWDRRGLGTPDFLTIPNPKMKTRRRSKKINLVLYGLKAALNQPFSSEPWGYILYPFLKPLWLKLAGRERLN